MNWRDIPTELYIGLPEFEERWTVEWHPRVTLRGREVNGLTCPAERKIQLDERLKSDPTRLAEIWDHELMHACFRYWTKKKPRAFDDDLEETVIRVLAPLLTRARRSAAIHARRR